jgi:hypothetical protein
MTLALPQNLPQRLWAAIREMGGPDNIKSLSFNLEYDAPIEVTVTYYPEPDKLNDAGVLVEIAKRYRLVEVEEDAEA